MTTHIRRVSLCFVSLLMLFPAKASVISYQFSGVVTQVPIDEVFGDVGFGDSFEGSFNFDTSAVDLVPSDPSTGSFSWTAPFGMTITVDGHQFDASDDLNIGVVDSFVDQYTVLAEDESLTIELFLEDPSGTAFSSDQLPAVFPPLSAFTRRDFHLDASLDAGEVQVDGQLSALTSTPEPSTPVAVTAGFIILGLLKQLIKRRRF